ncbi:transcription factor IIIA [Halyomorpha halys]|uniref:transcription factor IIIA n=1 Tax=Halyomorpha halys TaxID=286706 RepID=UPI0006D50E60|nr:transcription factor IIIA isoform X1 [Halyomorpha halys]XP_024215915.1 transcription factor IIIA isoform X1 [Halyomorpha halys]
MTRTSGSESSDVLENIFPVVTDSPRSPGKQAKKPHHCDFAGCNAQFSRPWRLQAHKAVHLGKRPFPCDFENCDKSYTSNYHLRRHKITAHKIKNIITKLIKCRHPGCPKEFKTLQFEKKHFTRTHEEKTCKTCGISFFKRNQLRKHLLTHSVDHPFSCNECNTGFDHLFLLKRHQRGHVLHLCPVKTCMEAYKNWSSLRKHLKSHPYDYICVYCKKGYRNKHFLETHIIRHMNKTLRVQSELKKFSCDLCQATLLGKASLRRHIRKIHEKTEIKNAEQSSSSNKPRAPRKDKGIPKKSFASVLSTLIVPKVIDDLLVKGEPTVEVVRIIQDGEM